MKSPDLHNRIRSVRRGIRRLQPIQHRIEIVRLRLEARSAEPRPVRVKVEGPEPADDQKEFITRKT
jgi:hypothetical protein